MKNISVILLYLAAANTVAAQHKAPTASQQKAIVALINQYSEAREKSDTVLLKNILTKDVDQLVSTGEWRTGIRAAIEGMLRSSTKSPGTRTLTVDKIRMLDANCAIVDCRYEIENGNSTIRKMWSSFTVILDRQAWKISAIRNMLPAGSK